MDKYSGKPWGQHWKIIGNNGTSMGNSENHEPILENRSKLWEKHGHILDIMEENRGHILETMEHIQESHEKKLQIMENDLRTSWNI